MSLFFCFLLCGYALPSNAAASGVTKQGAALIVTPNALASNNTVIVSIQNGKVDVKLNGVDNYFTVGTVQTVYLNGSSLAGNLTFTNKMHILTTVYGGKGTNTFTGGSGTDQFIGGTGTNYFHAGSGFSILVGNLGTNVYYESATGSGYIIKAGSSNTIIVPPNATGHYYLMS